MNTTSKAPQPDAETEEARRIANQVEAVVDLDEADMYRARMFAAVLQNAIAGRKTGVALHGLEIAMGAMLGEMSFEVRSIVCDHLTVKLRLYCLDDPQAEEALADVSNTRPKLNAEPLLKDGLRQVKAERDALAAKVADLETAVDLLKVENESLTQKAGEAINAHNSLLREFEGYCQKVASAYCGEIRPAKITDDPSAKVGPDFAVKMLDAALQVASAMEGTYVRVHVQTLREFRNTFCEFEQAKSAAQAKGEAA